MVGFYATAKGIPEYINMLEDAQLKAKRAKLPITNETLVAIATKAILSTNGFPRTTDAWEDLDPKDKTWSNWKDTYSKAFVKQELRLKAAGDGDRFGSAHAAPQDTPIDPTAPLPTPTPAATLNSSTTSMEHLTTSPTLLSTRRLSSSNLSTTTRSSSTQTNASSVKSRLFANKSTASRTSLEILQLLLPLVLLVPLPPPMLLAGLSAAIVSPMVISCALVTAAKPAAIVSATMTNLPPDAILWKAAKPTTRDGKPPEILGQEY
jgi:hypothetical protein